MDFETGDILWSKSLGGEYLIKLGFINAVPCSPAIADGKIYVGTASGLFSCFDLETGDMLWQYQTEGAILASPAVVYEKVFVASTDGKLYCFGIDPETYFEKAAKYEKQGDAERAREFYTRAKDHYYQQGNTSMVWKCKYELGKTYYWSAALVSFGMIGGALLVYLKKHKVSPKLSVITINILVIAAVSEVDGAVQESVAALDSGSLGSYHWALSHRHVVTRVTILVYPFSNLTRVFQFEVRHQSKTNVSNYQRGKISIGAPSHPYIDLELLDWPEHPCCRLVYLQ